MAIYISRARTKYGVFCKWFAGFQSFTLFSGVRIFNGSCGLCGERRRWQKETERRGYEKGEEKRKGVKKGVAEEEAVRNEGRRYGKRWGREK